MCLELNTKICCNPLAINLRHLNIGLIIVVTRTIANNVIMLMSHLRWRTG